jgi:hypothetical protein
VTVYLRPVDADRSQPACTRCGWIGEAQSDRRAAAAAWEHEQICQAVPNNHDTESSDGAP